MLPYVFRPQRASASMMLKAACFVFFTLAVSVFVPASPVVAAPLAASSAEILTVLPNGLTVYIIKDTRFPLVATRLYVRAGSADEEPRVAGISHVLEHMVFKGTQSRPKGQVARDVEALGGYLNAATSFDKTWYMTDMPAAHWRVGMEVVKDMAFHPSLDPKELESEKNVVISELESGLDSPMRRLFESLQTAALKNTVYGRPIIGYKDTIKGLTADDLRAYIRHWYQPRNMMLLVAGDVDSAAVLAHAQKLFGSLKNTSDLPVPQPADVRDAAGGPRVETSRGPWSKVYLGISFPVPGLKDLRSVDLDVLSYLLGGDGTSRFYRKYKYEKQLVDSIRVGNMSMARAGLLTITAQLDADKVDAFWQELTRDLAGLKASDFKADAITRAKFNLEDSLDRAGETLNGLASWRGVLQFDLGGEQGERNLRFAQRNVDTMQLQAALDQWVDSRQARVRVLAPQNAVLPDFEAVLQKNFPASMGRAHVAASATKAGARETVNLGAGRTLILIPDATVPYVSLDLMLPGGNALLKPEQQGLADLTARLLTDGSGKLDTQGIERWFAERAAAVSASAGMQTFTVSLTGPARFNADYFGMLHEILRKPRFDAAEVKREAADMKSAIKQRADRPLSYMFAALNPFLYSNGQVYGFDGLGSPQNLDRFSRKDAEAFWKLQSAQPWALSVAGSYDREVVLAFARSLSAPADSGIIINPPQWGTERKLDLHLPGRNQAHLLQVFKAVPPTHPDAPALMLLQSVLSGQSGLLFSRLRDEQGLAYTVTAFYRTMPEAGFMAFYIGTTPDKLEQSRKGFAEIIASLKEKTLPAKVLAAGANRLSGEYYRGLQSLESRAVEAATAAVLGHPQDFRAQLLEKAARITPEQLRETARKYLEPAGAYEVTLLP